MISFEYAGRQLRAVWRLAFSSDEGWRSELDGTVDGVFRSLWAIALSAPFALLTFLAGRRVIAQSPDYQQTVFAQAPGALLFLAEMISIVVSWAASLALLAAAARRLNASRRAADLIVAFNWSQFLAFSFAAAPAVAFVATDMVEAFALFALPAIALSTYLLWRVLRRNLPVGVGLAIGLLIGISILKVVVNTIIANGAVGLYGLFA